MTYGNNSVIGINGAAARLAQKDDLVIICAYESMSRQNAEEHEPIVLLMDKKNKVKERSVNLDVVS